jgi:hypothetical protein
MIKHDNLVFDISSRGTDATICVRSAIHRTGPIAPGDYTRGYSSGLAGSRRDARIARDVRDFYRTGIQN